MKAKEKKDQEILEEQEVKDRQEEASELEEEQPEDESTEVSAEDEIKELKDKYLRLYSEFENFRRRTAKERLALIGTASQEVIEGLLPVVDDFERALKAMEDNEQNEQAEGVKLVYNKFYNVLEQKGLKVMDCQRGGEFDAEFHEVVTQIPAPSEELKGKIVDVVEKGYLLGEKVIRFAKVVTGS